MYARRDGFARFGQLFGRGRSPKDHDSRSAVGHQLERTHALGFIERNRLAVIGARRPPAISSFTGCPSPARRSHGSQEGEPNVCRLPPTARDAVRPFLQARGSPADSLRPGQTGRSWLGVKGSRVQIPPSRLVR